MKKTLLLLLFTIIFGFQNGVCQAQNDLLKRVLKQLALQEKDIEKTLFASKILPHAKDKSVLTFPKYVSKSDDVYVFDAYIVVVDNQTGKILYKFYEPEAWESDAIMLVQITIDTGLFILNNETRAFGVRLNYHHTSNWDPYSRTDLSLFIVENNKLKRILEDYTISSYSGEFGPTCAGGNKEEMESVIDIDKQHQSNQFNDLVISETVTMTDYLKKKYPKYDQDCDEKRTTVKKIVRMKYDGRQYK
ncbi:MAG: hypothetical protein ACOVOW_02005 [Spirosomataceae bacterium]